MKKLNYCLMLIAFSCGLCGCIGSKGVDAEVTGIKIERKPSAGEEANSWAHAIRTLWTGEDNGSD